MVTLEEREKLLREKINILKALHDEVTDSDMRVELYERLYEIDITLSGEDGWV